MQEHRWVICMRAAFGLDVCYLFPQCVQAVITWISVVQVCGLCMVPGMWG